MFKYQCFPCGRNQSTHDTHWEAGRKCSSGRGPRKGEEEGRKAKGKKRTEGKNRSKAFANKEGKKG